MLWNPANANVTVSPAAGNPKVFFAAGADAYDGTGFRNSGVPPSDKPFSYSLTFTKPGRYEYACTIHPGNRKIASSAKESVIFTCRKSLLL